MTSIRSGHAATIRSTAFASLRTSKSARSDRKFGKCSNPEVSSEVLVMSRCSKLLNFAAPSQELMGFEAHRSEMRVPGH